MGTVRIFQEDGSCETLERETYPTLKELQTWVDGYIELAYSENGNKGTRHVYCNEEGLWRDDFSVNRWGTKKLDLPEFLSTVRGPVVLVEGLEDVDDD